MPRNSPHNKAVAELGRQPRDIYKKIYQPKHRKNGTFKKSKLGKYNNRGFTLDGAFFHSEAEANRYLQLKVLEAQNKIAQLERQVPYRIQIDGINICTYNADFRYFVRDHIGSISSIVIEDVKGLPTAEYRLKKKLVEAKHKIRIIELPAQWMKSYHGLNGLELEPIIKSLQDQKAQRASARREARRLATKAAQTEQTG